MDVKSAETVGAAGGRFDRGDFQESLREARRREHLHEVTPDRRGRTAPPPSRLSRLAAAGPKAAASALLARLAVTSAGTQQLTQARAGMHAEAQRLQEVGAEALGAVQERQRGRLQELLLRELTDAPPDPTARFASRALSPQGAEPGLAPGAAGGQGLAPASADERRAAREQAQLKTQAALALVERIEILLRSQRPALVLTLAGALKGTVEVERTGAQEVALKLRGERGPPPPEDVSRIRDALLGRGLKLSSLSVS